MRKWRVIVLTTIVIVLAAIVLALTNLREEGHMRKTGNDNENEK